MVTIAYLADHPDVIPTLADWFRTQWPAYYAQQTQANIEQEFHSEAIRDGIPLRLVAFESSELAGTIVLRERAIWTLPEYRPGLGGLYVDEMHRGRGIGTELVRAGMITARNQGYDMVFATTVLASGILERLEWERITSVLHQGEQLAVYRCVLNRRGPTPAPADRASP